MTYNKYPAIAVNGFIASGWDAIFEKLSKEFDTGRPLIVDGYTGVNYDQLIDTFSVLNPELIIDTRDLLISVEEVRSLTDRFITDDVLFGYLSNITLPEYFNRKKLLAARQAIHETKGRILVIGMGAQLVCNEGTIVYADMPRWEIIQRMRRCEARGIGIDNSKEAFSLQYKRGYFNDWRVLDRHKREIYDHVDYWLETVRKNFPKLIDKDTFQRAMDKAASSPFRVVPFFDPAPWGGQWMKTVMDLDKKTSNYGWCFDCVPEENSLLLQVQGESFEMPSVNLVYTRSTALLGAPVEARFGKDFPIRFDFLDTVGGGNLSLQVHPDTHYAREHFGLPYTQDESYYILDAEEGAEVYLGLKEDVKVAQLIEDLERAEDGVSGFEADKYVNKFPARKHDHFLIPGGTIHCSGAGALVLEISATPNIFTFKLWDWQRLGLDGKPRPINVQRGKHVINGERNTKYALEHLVNRFEEVASGQGWKEERTGLHRNEFIEVRRHTFTGQVRHFTDESVNVLNLVEGEEVIVESPEGHFEPTVFRYAETFIIPAAIGEYTITPVGLSQGKTCITVKASVRI